MKTLTWLRKVLQHADIDVYDILNYAGIYDSLFRQSNYKWISIKFWSSSLFDSWSSQRREVSISMYDWWFQRRIEMSTEAWHVLSAPSNALPADSEVTCTFTLTDKQESPRIPSGHTYWLIFYFISICLLIDIFNLIINYYFIFINVSHQHYRSTGLE